MGIADSRLNFMADASLGEARYVLEDRMSAMGDQIGARNFRALLDPLMAAVLESAMERVGGSDTAIWLVDRSREHLVAGFTTEERFQEFVGTYRQPLGKGLISMVFASEQPYCENEVYKSKSHDDTLNKKLGVITCAMIALPLYFAGALRGVVSCVQLKPAGSKQPDPPGFSAAHLTEMSKAASLLERLIDHRLMKIGLGLENA